MRAAAANGLARFPAEATSAARTRLQSADKTAHETAFILAYHIFRAPGASVADARELLPLLEAAQKKARGNAKRNAAAAIDAMRALVDRPVPAADLPGKDDLEVLASGAPRDSAIAERIRAAFRYRQKGLISFSELADAAGVSEDEVRPHAAKVAIAKDELRWCARGLYRYENSFADKAA
ncbi:MAG: hypothetical protein OEY14_14465, partial [Myxococcales bacterium]|nr:hypothetical protein [Myxococcales bacterium]